MEANIVFFIILSILCQAKTVEVDQEDSTENLLSGDWHEENDSDDEALSSYSYSLRSNVKKLKKHYRRVCKELVKFVPDVCTYAKAKERCSMYCDAGKTQPALECGLKTSTKNSKKDDVESTAFRRVVGGVESTEGEWPWMARLVPEGNPFFCSGAILSRHFILTAAYCFEDIQKDPNKWTVYTGDFSRSATDSEEQSHKIKRMIKHEHHIYLYNDIAIVQLDTPVKMLDKKKGRICLPDNDHKPPNGHKCYLAGWGNQNEGARISPDKLRHVGLKLVPRKECNKKESYDGTISKTLLCAGYKEGGKDRCLNDNGGSLVCNVDDRWYTTGISSMGLGCGRPKKYGIYTKVAKFRRWIVEKILENSEPF